MGEGCIGELGVQVRETILELGCTSFRAWNLCIQFVVVYGVILATYLH